MARRLIEGRHRTKLRSHSVPSKCATIGLVASGFQSLWHKHPGVGSGVGSGNELTVGERSADKMRNIMGCFPPTPPSR